MKLTKLFGILLFVIAFVGNAMGQTYKVEQGYNVKILNSEFTKCEDMNAWYCHVETTQGNNNVLYIKDGDNRLETTVVESSADKIKIQKDWDGDNSQKLRIIKNGSYYIVFYDKTNEVALYDATGFDCSKIETPTQTGDDYAKYLVDDGNGCKKLKITTTAEVGIPSGVELNITSIELPKNGKLKNDGTINFKNCSTGEYSDFNFVKGVYTGNNTFINNGTIHCNNWNGKIDVYNSSPLTFQNNGEIICENDFNLNWGDHHSFTQSCSSNISAKKIYVYSNLPLQFIGGYECDIMVLDSQSGFSATFGNTTCSSGESKVVVRKEMSIITGTTSLILNADASIKVIKSTTNSALRIDMNGNVIIGEATGNLGINTLPPSILTICYNPTVGGEDNILKGANNGQGGSYQGKVIYRVTDGSAHDANYWTTTSTPLTEKDISNGIPSNKVIGNKVSFEECMQGLQHFLGIDDDPFLPKDKEIRRLYNCNPCSKDFEDTKIELREIHGRTFRLINGELIYCENDN